MWPVENLKSHYISIGRCWSIDNRKMQISKYAESLHILLEGSLTFDTLHETRDPRSLVEGGEEHCGGRAVSIFSASFYAG